MANCLLHCSLLVCLCLFYSCNSNKSFCAHQDHPKNELVVEIEFFDGGAAYSEVLDRVGKTPLYNVQISSAQNLFLGTRTIKLFYHNVEEERINKVIESLRGCHDILQVTETKL